MLLASDTPTRVLELLRDWYAADVVIVVGGTISAKDIELLNELGAAAVLGPGVAVHPNSLAPRAHRLGASTRSPSLRW